MTTTRFIVEVDGIADSGWDPVQWLKLALPGTCFDGHGGPQIRIALAEPAPVRLVNVGPDGDDEMFVVELHRDGIPKHDLLLIVLNAELGVAQVGTWDNTLDGDDYRQLDEFPLP